MLKIKAFQLIMFFLTALLTVFFFIGIINAESDDEKIADLLLSINSVAAEHNEMPAVGFSHDLHTKTLNGDCSACHIEPAETGQKFVFKFKRTSEMPSMNFYHDNCVSCHLEKKQENKAFGPDASQCRVCHTGATLKPSAFSKIVFSRPLHFIHESSEQIKGITASDETNCSSCHHKHNEKSREIFYIKGEEAACIYCHKQKKQNDIRSVRHASHDSCVACHQNLKGLKDLKGQKIKTGPVNCKGCHSPQMQKQVQKKVQAIKDIPRIKRNQPDLVALTGWNKDHKGDNKTDTPFMNAVPFNHKAHETVTETCKTCHHNSIKKCNDCHSADGGKIAGRFIGLETAMHKADSKRSCIGCHNTAVKDKDCAGCHFFMKTDTADSDSCKTCHIPPDTDDPVLSSVQTDYAVDIDHNFQNIENIMQERLENYKKVPENKIPEIVKIDVLEKEYKASFFPHRKVVKAVFERAEKTELAKVFHVDQARLCMGCHHNSPKSFEPPKCASCHSKVNPGLSSMTVLKGQGGRLDDRPGLKGAYHGQCITCHKQMKVESIAATDCAKCHEERK